MTTELISTTPDYSKAEVVDVIKKTVAIGATDAELQVFFGLCKATGLNPFKKEVWFIKAGNKAQIMTGINGFFTVANNNPNFDGHESGLVAPDGSFVSAAYPKDDFIGGWAKVYRKDRRIPTEGIAMVKDYDKKQSNWNTMKRVMIIKCAESVALRKAFPQEMNGLYTAEEMPVEYSLKTPKQIDADEAAVRAEVGSVLPSPKEELETYIVATVGSKYEGSMLCEIDPDYIEKVVTTPKSLSRFTAQDAANLQAYYQQFIRVTYVKKEDQKAKLQKQAEELKGETYVAVEPNSGEVIE